MTSLSIISRKLAFDISIPVLLGSTAKLLLSVRKLIVMKIFKKHTYGSGYLGKDQVNFVEDSF